MRTYILLSQHKKCSDILEAIAKCDQRISMCKTSINFHKATNPFSDVIEHYYTRWDITLKIKERLAAYYSRTLTSVVRPTVDKILQTA